MRKQGLSSSGQIKTGAIMSYLTILFNIIAGILYTPFIVDVIGAKQYGLYTLATSLISMFMVDFGISSAVAKFVSKYMAEGDEQRVNNFVGIVYKLYLIIDMVVFGILLVAWFFIDTLYVGLTPSELETFKVIYVIIAIYHLIAFPFSTLNGVLTSYEKFFQLKLTGLINKFGTVICTVVVLLLNGGLYSLVLINVIWNLLTVAVRFIIVKRTTNVKANLRFFDFGEIKTIFSFSIWTTIIGIMSRLIFSIMPTILAALTDSVSISIFGIASTLEGYVFMFSDAINGMFLSKTTRTVAKDKENQQDNLLKLMIKVGRINLSIVAIVVLGVIVAGKEFIFLWMGEDFIPAYYCMIFMVLPGIGYCPQQIARTALIVQDKIKYQAYVYSFICVLNLIVSVVFIKIMGVIGAGISIGITYTLRFIIMNYVFDKKLGLDIKKFFYSCHISFALPIILTTIIGFCVFLIPTMGWIVFGVKCAFVGLIYVFLMWRFAWNLEEKKLFSDIINKFIGKKKIV